MAMDPNHNREWLMETMTSNQMNQFFYSSVFVNLSIGMGALAITLRDKKLISKWAEQLLCVTFMIPALGLPLTSFL